MTIPFYTLNIHEPLQQMLYDADNSGDFQPVIDYCEPLIETTEEDGVLLCYTFALMETAKSIHVDDIEEKGKKCLEILKRLQHTYGGTDFLKVQIKREIKQAKLLKKADKELLTKPIENLTTKEKSKLAYQLCEKGGVENIAKAALLHVELMRKNENVLDEPYHFGQYIVCLYQSNQVALADKTFDEFIIWQENNVNTGYSFLISTCYQEKILAYINDTKKIQEIWDAAFNNKFVKKDNHFPYAESVQDKLIIATHEFGLTEIKDFLIDIVVAQRKPRLIPDAVKKIMGI